jgi:peptide/nickel transport system substrate-binding protein
MRRLPPSDRAIASLLALVVAISSLAALVALERTILVQVPARGGSLTEGIVGAPRFVNPLLALTDADRDLATLTYAGLMGEGVDGLRPVLAESYTVSPDGKVYTFTLKPNLRFTDGTPITASDVVFTVEKAQDSALKSPRYADFAGIRVEAVDARTVRFTLAKAYAPFLANTTLGILPMHIWKNVSDAQFPFDPHMANPVGAGPFRVVRIVRDRMGNVTEYDLGANGTYAIGRPYLDEIDFKLYGSTEEVAAAYKNGAIDSAYGIPTPGAHTAPYSRVFGVFFNQSANPALKQLAVRKALSIAIDRETLTQNMLGGYASPITGPAPSGSGITGPAFPAAADRIAAAKKVLTDGGWTMSSSTGVWTNAKLKLTLPGLTITTSNVPELKSLADQVQADWQALGVPTSLTFDDPNALITTAIRPRSYETLYFGMVIGRDEDLFPFWDSSESKDPGLNITGYSNKSVDTLLEKARTETDPSLRMQDLQKASDQIASDYPAAFTHSPDFVYALPKELEGVSLPQITTPSDRFASVATWHVKSEWVWPFFAKDQIR